MMNTQVTYNLSVSTLTVNIILLIDSIIKHVIGVFSGGSAVGQAAELPLNTPF